MSDRDYYKKLQETADLRPFLTAYESATGVSLDCGPDEAPDFICVMSDGSEIGIELTQIRRSPDEIFGDRIFHQREDMDFDLAADMVLRMIEQKSDKLSKYATDRTILVLQNCEADFDFLCKAFVATWGDDLGEFGFDEIWLVDYQGIRDGAHREVILFGLYPEHYREFTERSWFDQKPYG